MIICVASGKGGTGKTTVAVNLALAYKRDLTLLDCDVEEPNIHLFLKPDIQHQTAVYMEVPGIDADSCNLCGRCQEICQFNALAVLPQMVLTFPELCHSCGGCFLVCPVGAIKAQARLIGSIETGTRGQIRFAHGRLRIGEAMAPPLIRRVKTLAAPDGITIVDAPPGTSCPVVAALWGADFVILVTEPTPFGLHDLELAVGAVRELGIPMGLVINRADLGDRRVYDYAAQQNLPILLEIPFDRQAAAAYARGELLVETLPLWRQLMEQLIINLNHIIKLLFERPLLRQELK